MARQIEKVAETRSLGETVYRKIREDIISCLLPPGASCTEGQLAESYGVGKAPVRLALAALSREGLVAAQPRQGHIVSPITIESVNDVFGVRLMIEPATARLAAGRANVALLKTMQDRLKQEDLELRAIRAKAPKGRAPHDRARERRWIEANSDFHIEIARATGNERLVKITRAMHEESQRALHMIFAVYDQAGIMADDHPNLMRALDQGDADAAETAARIHLEHSRRIVIDALLDSATIRRQTTAR